MKALFPVTALACVLGFAPAPPDKFTFVDLEPYANRKRDENFGSGRDGNDLKDLGKKGGRTFDGVNFKIGDGVVELSSPALPVKRPNKVEGIRVGNKPCIKIH